MVSKPKECIFCGSKPLSEEHIWSEWTYKILPKVKGASHTRGIIDTARGAPAKRRTVVARKSYQGSVNTIRIRAVCTSKPKSTNSVGKVGCNNGWMGDLETKVKPILTPLVLDQPTVLGRERQRILAAWIATKVMVAEYSDPARVVSTQSDRTLLFETHEPPQTWKIWMGRQAGQEWYMRYSRNSVTIVSSDGDGKPVVPLGGAVPKNTQLVTIGMGYVFFHVFSSANPDLLLRVNYPNKVALFRVHPFDSGFFWPPSVIFRDAHISALTHNFDRFLDGLPWIPKGAS